MRRLWRNNFKIHTAAVLAAFLFLLSGISALAAEEKPLVLRVAFPQVRGLTETASDGTRYGLVVDYLNEIAKYTGWEYEYIDVDSAEEMAVDFAAGKYELMGGQYYLPGLEEICAYPDFNTGYSRSTLLARRDDRSVRSNDLESLNGKTIGVYERAEENIRRLQEFLKMNGLNCSLRYYSYEELSETGDLYYYLENGEVDLLLGNLVEGVETLRVVVSYNSQPYYIVTNVGNKEVLDGLNMALERITDANPDFATECYSANFPDISVDIQLTDQELSYIRNKKSITVALPGEWHPLFCKLTKDSLHDGLIPDILEEVSAFTGLEFSFITTENYIDAVRLVQQGEADVLGFFEGTEENAAEQGLALTTSYANMNAIIVRNMTSGYPSGELTAAMIEGQELPGNIPAAKVRYYAGVTEALLAVNSGECDFIYGLAARFEQDIQNYQLSNLVPVTLVNTNSDICFALARPVDPELLTILNKAVNNLSVGEKHTLLNKNMVSIGNGGLSLKKLIYAKPIWFVSILGVFFTILAATVLLIARTRMKHAVMQSNLEKIEAESRAKGEFLSRMSHELRTPMNAVVGLADLTERMEGAPENVRQNLSKIKTAARYLLSLINDILDMGRIDNGMLFISDEPFFLKEMLTDLQNMMESEAKSRKLSFFLEQNIVHDELIGDAIRLRQVLTNLLSNSFKFTSAGGNVRLCVKEERASETEAVFTFRVIDDGIGIRTEDQHRIFDSFEQIGPNFSKSQGTGLGLTISSNIVQLMGGTLCLESEYGKGSEFYFTVTFLLNNKEKRKEFPAGGEQFLKDMCILLAEDNDLNAEIAMQLLEMQGASVFWCQNGKIALERFGQSEPGTFQLILMDVQMPEMNGLEATRAIRELKHPDAVQIPIVAMTASSFQSDVDAAYDAGMSGFISKPIDVDYLYHVLKKFLL